MITDLILGTAGHIDHGKTSLIKSLTGTDTDRLPEEKRRGITIELGFAELQVGDFRLGIVDVPGHERFVRQMLAGATGMDLAMLVVAADDSVKPQTREHLDVLRILDLPAGVLVLTKCDLAEADWIALVEEEVRELVPGSFLEGAPLVRTSAATGQGMDELRQALQQAAQRAARQSACPPNSAAVSLGDRPRLHDRRSRHGGHGQRVRRPDLRRRSTGDRARWDRGARPGFAESRSSRLAGAARPGPRRSTWREFTTIRSRAATNWPRRATWCPAVC